MLHTGFLCTLCGRQYKVISSLRVHQKWECGKEPQFDCPFCEYRARHKCHLKLHLKRIHRTKRSRIPKQDFEHSIISNK